jgi:hypothetical protein
VSPAPTNASDFPSGDHLGHQQARLPVVTCTAGPATRPSRTFETNTWFTPFERSDTKASWVPSGDHAGWTSVAGWSVNWCAGPPSTAAIQAYISNSDVTAGGALTVSASTASSIDAIVIAAAVGVGGAVGVGVGAAGAGSYASNKIQAGVNAYIDGDATQFEREPLTRLAADGELMAYRHEAFWQCMDTLQDRNILEGLWHKNSPWKVWKEIYE